MKARARAGYFIFRLTCNTKEEKAVFVVFVVVVVVVVYQLY